MKISGLQKMTLLDYPGKVACTAFLQGCNFRCPFCHNSALLGGAADEGMTMEQLLSFLEKRRGLLDAVCVSGGEPTLSPGLEELLLGIKALGYAVKLDTNGSHPEIIRALAEKGLLDYIAMDVKNGPSRYGETIGDSRVSLSPLEESLRFLFSGSIPYELRTTVTMQLHDEASIREMGEWLSALAAPGKAAALYLQYFADRESVLCPGLTAPAPETMAQYAAILRPCAEKIGIRGG